MSTYPHPDETDLDTYDTDHLRRARQTPTIAAELQRRDAAQAARRRCDECWHEQGAHSPLCSSVTQATQCECCCAVCGTDDHDLERHADRDAARAA